MELFHHYLTDPVLQQGDDASLWRDRVPRLGFRYGCVLHMLLAVSALHLARTDPVHHSPQLRRVAEKHAGTGIRETMALLPELNRHNCGALYISTILIFVFSLAKGPSPTDMFLVADGAEVPWWEPLKGVRLVLETMGPAAIFSGILEPSENDKPETEETATGGATTGPIVATALRWGESLRSVFRLVHVTTSPCPATDMFHRMLDGLADCFQATFGTPAEPQECGMGGRFEVVMLWLYRMEDDFALQVRQHHPVAVVLLAHFAVLLQTMEHAWFMKGWAKHILGRATEILAAQTASVELLRWPTEAINDLAALSS